MFEQEYKDTFAKVTASEETYRRVMSMAKEKKKHPSTGFVSKLSIAAVMVSLLVVSVGASEVVRNWFQSYFYKESDSSLSQAQVEFIEENVQDINQRQTCNGYTMEVKSVLTDGRNAYIAISITAPEGIYLDRTVKEGYNPAAPNIWTEGLLVETDGGYSATWQMAEDGDGKPNTHNMVILLSGDESSFINGKTCHIHFTNLKAEYTNDAFGAKMKEKYGCEPKLGILTDEEAEKMWPVETLVEGNWDFEVTFTNTDVPVKELIDHPVNYVLEYETPEGKVTKTTKVLSIRLSAIGAVCTYEAGKNAPDGIGGYIFMKDGTSISLAGNTVGSSWEGGSCGMFDIPIALEDVAYILFPDGTKILSE